MRPHRWMSRMSPVAKSGDVHYVGERGRPLIIPSHFTTQIDMLKSGENDNQAENPPGYLLSDIKRRSLSSLLDRIPRKKSPATRAERQSSVTL